MSSPLRCGYATTHTFLHRTRSLDLASHSWCTVRKKKRFCPWKRYGWPTPTTYSTEGFVSYWYGCAYSHDVQLVKFLLCNMVVLTHKTYSQVWTALLFIYFLTVIDENLPFLWTRAMIFSLQSHWVPWRWYAFDDLNRHGRVHESMNGWFLIQDVRQRLK